MTLKQTFLPALAIFILCALTAIGFITTASAAAPSGLYATESVATTTTVGPANNVTIFSADVASNSCAARVISTQAQGIMLIFADPTNGDLSSTSLSGAKGFWQAGSTTVAYDGGQYGCGRMVGYAGVSTTITAMVTR